jgi:hypothetical protein
MARPSLRKCLIFLAAKLAQAMVVLVGGGLMLLVLTFAMSPSDPGGSGDWVWIDAPKIPFLWHRGWWLRCNPGPQPSTAHCILVTGSDHSQVYSGSYILCDGDASQLKPPIRPKAPAHSSEMWVVTSRNHEPAPLVYLETGALLAPVDASANCAQLKAHSR